MGFGVEQRTTLDVLLDGRRRPPRGPSSPARRLWQAVPSRGRAGGAWAGRVSLTLQGQAASGTCARATSRVREHSTVRSTPARAPGPWARQTGDRRLEESCGLRARPALAPQAAVDALGGGAALHLPHLCPHHQGVIRHPPGRGVKQCWRQREVISVCVAEDCCDRRAEHRAQASGADVSRQRCHGSKGCLRCVHERRREPAHPPPPHAAAPRPGGRAVRSSPPTSFLPYGAPRAPVARAGLASSTLCLCSRTTRHAMRAGHFIWGFALHISRRRLTRDAV